MTPFQKFVDNWLYANADCNLVAFTRGMVNGTIVGNLLLAIEQKFCGIEILNPRTRVKIGLNGADILGIIDAVTVESNFRVTYAVIWWDGRVRKREWLERDEVTAFDNSDVDTIGFRP